MRGIDGETAARFSFLLALPAVFGAAILSLKDLGQVNGHALLPYVAGTLAALLTGLCCIHLLMGIIRRRRLHWFALYCWLVGGVGLILFF
jgi:undecaprenyl-diphosphatase